MNIDLVNFYFGMFLSALAVFLIIYFVFVIKEPANEGEKDLKRILWEIRQHWGLIIFKFASINLIIMMFAFIVRGLRDIPYIINRQPETARIEVLTGFSSNTSRSRNIYVRNLSTNEIFEIQAMSREVLSGSIYDIEFLPNTGWASLNEINE